MTYTLLRYFGMNPIMERENPWSHKIPTKLTVTIQKTGVPEALQIELLIRWNTLPWVCQVIYQLYFYCITLVVTKNIFNELFLYELIMLLSIVEGHLKKTLQYQAWEAVFWALGQGCPIAFQNVQSFVVSLHCFPDVNGKPLFLKTPFTEDAEPWTGGDLKVLLPWGLYIMAFVEGNVQASKGRK